MLLLLCEPFASLEPVSILRPKVRIGDLESVREVDDLITLETGGFLVLGTQRVTYSLIRLPEVGNHNEDLARGCPRTYRLVSDRAPIQMTI